MNRHRRGVQGQRGAVAIEFAVVLPIFLLLLYALISYSVAMMQQHQLTQVASEAARSAAVVASAPWLAEEDVESDAAQRVLDSISTMGWSAEQTPGCADGARVRLEGDSLIVCLERRPAITPLTLLGISVPDLPEALSGRAVVKL